MDIHAYNEGAWDREVELKNRWTQPVDAKTIEEARKGYWSILLTPTVPVPEDWFHGVLGKKILCLASGGGQQAPILASIGAEVTVFDNCQAQLDQDSLVAERENLSIERVKGTMEDLSVFGNGVFDVILHPVSNCFVPVVEPVWRECYRVLKKGGRLLSGFCNPLVYIFDFTLWDRERRLEVTYKIPYSDLDQLPREELEERIRSKEPLEFGHSLESQIGGQLQAGFIIQGFYEDTAGGDLLDSYIKTFIATLAIKE